MILEQKISRIIKIISKDLTPWIETRSSRFKIKLATSDNYYLLQRSQQNLQLRSITSSMEDLLQLIYKGKTEHMMHILASLRSLIYYNDRNSYDPLLFRLAAYQKVELPVYVNCTFPDSSWDGPSFSMVAFAQSRPTDINTKIIDFQEYQKLSKHLKQLVHTMILKHLIELLWSGNLNSHTF